MTTSESGISEDSRKNCPKKSKDIWDRRTSSNTINGYESYKNGYHFSRDRRDSVSCVSGLKVKVDVSREDENDDEAGETGCCGRKRKEKVPMVSTLELFKFASSFDVLLMAIGAVSACVLGALVPVNLAVFGEALNIFLEHHSLFHNTTGNVINQSQIEDFGLEAKIQPHIYTLIGLALLAFVSSCFSIMMWQWAADRQVSTIRKKFFHAVMRQDIGWFDVTRGKELSTMFSGDITTIADGLGDKMALFIQWGSIWMGSYILAFVRDWRLGLLVVPFSPPVIAVCGIFFKIYKDLSAKESQAYAKAGMIAEESLRGVKTVQAFQGQEKEVARYERNLQTALKVAVKKGFALGLPDSAYWFLVYTFFAITMWVGIVLVEEEDINPGHIIPIFFGFMLGSMALGNAFSNMGILASARAAAIKVFEIINLVPQIDIDSPAGLKPAFLKGHLKFKNVQFSYPSRPGVQILQDINLEILPGERVALVGPSGCGKSTIVRLLQRFYDATSGMVTVDGIDIKDLNLKWLRDQIGVVSQEPVLFDASIEDNIRFGKMEATRKDIEEAAKAANAHDFISDLPQGYKTNVGERGAQLSGGQKQRISIARALVRNPKILLLDEATSALDHHSEAVVQSALEKAEIGRTTITIAHRLSTIRNASKIIAVSEGEVIEEGTHDQLMEEKSLYYNMVKIQTRLEEEEDVDIADVEIVEKESDGEIHTVFNGVYRASFRRPSSPKISAIKAVNKSVEKGTVMTQTKDTEVASVSLAEIMKYNSPEWTIIILGCMSSVIAGVVFPAFNVFVTEYIKILTVPDRDEQWERTHILAGGVLGTAVIAAVAKILQNTSFSKSGARLMERLRRLTFTSIINQISKGHAQNLTDMEYFDQPENQVGALTSQLSRDAAMIHNATGFKLGHIFETLTNLTTSLVIAFVSSWKMTLVILGFLPLMITSGLLQGKVVVGAAKKEEPHLKLAGKLYSEITDNINTVACLSRENYFRDKFNSLIDASQRPSLKMSFLYGVLYGFANCQIHLAYAAAFKYGTQLITDREIDFADGYRVFGVIVYGGDMIGRHSTYGVDYTKAKLAAARILALIKRQPAVDAREEGGIHLTDFQGSITFTNAIYHYPTRPNLPVLNGLNLVVNPGETVALVGASGCGKSTTVQLIERFYDLDHGALMVDGQDMKTLNLRSYRKKLGIVSQEPTLFDCSIAENIAYGDTSRVVPMEEIMQAARNANIHTFITGLPKGYDTNVGDKGTQLSGGQKQRIAIARALVRNPKVLLLDEATSALDSESEKVVQDALDQASVGRTCIIIAHRLSTIQHADKIAVISKGKVAEIGTHTHLMSIKGAYYRLLKTQKESDNNDS